MRDAETKKVLGKLEELGDSLNGMGYYGPSTICQAAINLIERLAPEEI